MLSNYLTDEKGRIWSDPNGTPLRGQRKLTEKEVADAARANPQDYLELQVWGTNDKGLAEMIAPVPESVMTPQEKAKLRNQKKSNKA